MKNFLFVFSNRRAHVDNDIIRSLDNFIVKHRDLNIETVITQHAQHLSDAIIKFSNKHEQAIVVVAGGDGSLNEAANAIMNLPENKKIALCPIPYGTSNDFCKLFYKDFDFDWFLSELLNYEITNIDILNLTGNMRLLGAGPDTVNLEHNEYIDQIYVLNVMSLGLDTEILRTAFKYMARFPKLRATSYYFAILKHYLRFRLKTIPLQIKLDDHIIEQDSLLAAFCNGGFYGNGFNPAPDCDLQDGRLNYCVAPRYSHTQFAKIAVKYKKGEIKEVSSVILGNSKSALITASDNRPILSNYDGILIESNEMKIETLHQVLPVVLVGEKAKTRIISK